MARDMDKVKALIVGEVIFALRILITEPSIKDSFFPVRNKIGGKSVRAIFGAMTRQAIGRKITLNSRMSRSRMQHRFFFGELKHRENFPPSGLSPNSLTLGNEWCRSSGFIIVA